MVCPRKWVFTLSHENSLWRLGEGSAPLPRVLFLPWVSLCLFRERKPEDLSSTTCHPSRFRHENWFKSGERKELFSSLNVLLSLKSHQGCNKHHTPKPQKKILHFRWVDFLGSPLDGLAMMYLLFIKVKCVPPTVPVALFWKLKSPADASPGFFSKLFSLSRLCFLTWYWHGSLRHLES